MKTMIEHYIAHILKKSGENKQKLERKNTIALIFLL